MLGHHFSTIYFSQCALAPLVIGKDHGQLLIKSAPNSLFKQKVNVKIRGHQLDYNT